MSIGFWDYVSLGRPHWRGEHSLPRAAFFRVLGSPAMHSRIRNTHALNLVERLTLPQEARTLELGAGRGIGLFWLAQHHPEWTLTGIDIDPEMTGMSERAARRGGWENLTFVEGAAADLEADEPYDLVLCIDTLEHIVDDYGLLITILRALKPGGHLILHVPRRRHEQWRWIRAFHGFEVDDHVRDEYEKEELLRLLLRTGFRVSEFKQTFGRWGEISFELNSIGWRTPTLHSLVALLTYPVAVLLGYWDTRRTPESGNGYLVAAQPGHAETP